MKEKRTKKESNKKESEENSRYVTDFVVNEKLGRRPELRIDWTSFMKFCNNEIDFYNSSIAKLHYISPGMKTWIQKLANMWNTKKAIMDAVIKMVKSDFLNGRKKGVATDRRFVASFYWLFHKEENFNKVLNGYYDNPEDAKTAEEIRIEAEEQRKVKAEEQRREARRIEEAERAERRWQREFDEAHRATPEELEKIFAEFELPPLTTDDAVKP